MTDDPALFDFNDPGPEEIIAMAEEYEPAARFVGYSGGDDSLVAAHWTMTNVPGCRVLHVNTGIGIERTRQHVRETCDRYDWPLTEIRALEDCGEDYDAIVLKNGFPGPAMHGRMYQRLKERAIRKVVARSKNRRRDKVMISTGIRQDESQRRMGYGDTVVDFVGAQMWVNPLYWRPKSWFMDYIAEHKLPRSPVSQMLGMSGECLCGAFAHPGEKALVRIVDPDTADRIDALEIRVREAGHNWGWEDRPPREAPDDGRQPDMFMPFCRGCEKIGHSPLSTTPAEGHGTNTSDSGGKNNDPRIRSE